MNMRWTLWFFNIAMERSTIFDRNTIYKWAIYTMTMLNNQRVNLKLVQGITELVNFLDETVTGMGKYVAYSPRRF